MEEHEMRVDWWMPEEQQEEEDDWNKGSKIVESDLLELEEDDCMKLDSELEIATSEYEDAKIASSDEDVPDLALVGYDDPDIIAEFSPEVKKCFSDMMDDHLSHCGLAFDDSDWVSSASDKELKRILGIHNTSKADRCHVINGWKKVNCKKQFNKTKKDRGKHCCDVNHTAIECLLPRMKIKTQDNEYVSDDNYFTCLSSIEEVVNLSEEVRINKPNEMGSQSVHKTNQNARHSKGTYVR